MPASPEKKKKKEMFALIQWLRHSVLPDYYKRCLALILCQARGMILPILNCKASINYINVPAITAIITLLMVLGFVLVLLSVWGCRWLSNGRFPVCDRNRNSSAERKWIKMTFSFSEPDSHSLSAPCHASPNTVNHWTLVAISVIKLSSCLCLVITWNMTCGKTF